MTPHLKSAVFSRTFSRSLAGVAACLLLSASGLVSAGPLEDRDEAAKLYKAGNLDGASGKINSFLSAQPKDPQGRFIKGLIQTEQKKIPEAIQTFTGLTEDFPELPEPYNNLAVLYASQGNYDKAKAALELAIHTHPSYATAHENLGDVYAQLARRAYDKALQLDKNNPAALQKLAMVKDLFSAPNKTSAPIKVAQAPAAKVEPRKPEPAQKPAPKPIQTPPPDVSAKTAAPAASAKPAAPVPAAPAASESDAEKQLTAAVNAWAKAWSDKNVADYLAAYAKDFETPDGLSRSAWSQQRKERIEGPKSISVEITINKISVNGAEATVQFRQKYRSDSFKANGNKTLSFIRSGDKWLIRQERVG